MLPRTLKLVSVVPECPAADRAAEVVVRQDRRNRTCSVGADLRNATRLLLHVSTVRSGLACTRKGLADTVFRYAHGNILNVERQALKQIMYSKTADL